MSSYIQKDVQTRFDVILVGDSGVGKSALLTRFTRNDFDFISVSTIGTDFGSKVIELQPRSLGDALVKVTLLVWDTAGQEQYRAFAQSYYRKAIGVLLVYDVTRRESFDDLRVWLEDFKRVCDPQNVVFLIIGAKADKSLGDKAYPPVMERRAYYVPKREVLAEEGRRWAKNSEYEMLWMETSAKDDVNIDEAFQLLAETIYCKVHSGELSLPALHNSETIVLKKPQLVVKPRTANGQPGDARRSPKKEAETTPQRSSCSC